jgi:phosphoserine phosphatase RsbU/P
VKFDLKARWRRFGKLDKTFLILLLVYLILLAFAAQSGFRLFFQFLVIVLGIALLLRLSRVALRKAIWRLRNRLIVTYLLIAVVPILLIVTLFGLGTYMLTGQVAVYLARSELDRRVGAMQSVTDALFHTDPSIRFESLRRTGEIYRERYPNLFLLIDNRGEILRWSADATITAPLHPLENASGIATREGHYFAWAQTVQNGTRFIAATPLNRRYLSEMVPGLGDLYFLQVSAVPPAKIDTKGKVLITTKTGKQEAIIVGDQQFQNSPSGHEAPGLVFPAPVNQLDLAITWPSIVPVLDWETGEKKSALLVVHTRYSAVLQLILSQKLDEFQGAVPIALMVVSITFLIVELVSLFIGISLTRTITGAVHSLYLGTQRVMQGDFSNRISVIGRDQLGDLSKSFNTMTENLERLLAVAKEKERMQAEIEIAREVQEQLYPKTVPLLKTLSVTGLCAPARMVSGDYYDYQKLAGNKLAIAIGDVAGKGISAALLMASIQSGMRMELRASLDLADPSQSMNGFRLSTARMVSELNQQLHATTSPEKFATFFFALYDEESGALNYTNAGHLPPILIRDGGSTLLEVNGTVVGAFPFSKYEESKIQLLPGDLLVCYTDGITEPENEYGEMFGEERLIELVAKNADRDDDHVIRTVMDAVRQWTGVPELSDDMTILLVRKQ